MPADSSLQERARRAESAPIAARPRRRTRSSPTPPVRPTSAAAAAPGKAITASVCPANASPRSTITQPTRPAITATIPPASERVDHEVVFEQLAHVVGEVPAEVGLAISASMGVRVGLVAVVVMRGRLRLTDHDQTAVGGPQHLHRDPVEALSVSLVITCSTGPSTAWPAAR